MVIALADPRLVVTLNPRAESCTSRTSAKFGKLQLALGLGQSIAEECKVINLHKPTYQVPSTKREIEKWHGKREKEQHESQKKNA
jgi:hypothetical protein